MVPSGPPTPIGNGQSIPPSLLRSNSGILGAQGASLPSQTAFSSLVSPRNHYSNVNLLGNMSPLLNQSYGNGIPTQRGGLDAGAEPDPLSGVGNGMGFNVQTAFMPSTMVSTGLVQGPQYSNSSNNQLLSDQQQSQVDSRNFQQSAQQFSAQNSQQMQQQQFQAIRGGLGSVGPVKLEPQVSNDQHATQQAQSMRNLAQVKLEPQHISTMRNLAPVKLESQHSDQSLFLHQHQQQQQQQQQQFLQMSRQTSQATAAQFNMLTQQRLLQLQQQQQQQQQLLKAMPQQRTQLAQQLQQQNLSLRPTMKPYEPGMCARRLTHYMYQQQHRPEDNNIEFWRKFVTEYFAPKAKKKWCVSMYGSGRQTTGVFPQDLWHCEICNRKPGRGFEATVEVLPRLFKIKYESGTLEELLYVDMPREYQNPSGQIVLDYAKAIQESVFEQLRVVREGQLRIVFTPDLKICSWEFCARRHEELIPRRLLIPQVSQLGAAAQKYTQNASSNLSVQELQNNCNMFVASARQLAKALEVPLVNDLGYTKRYVRCLQISEVVNSMKDLIDYSRETGTGPMESLAKFPRRPSSLLYHSQAEDQAPLTTNSEQTSSHIGAGNAVSASMNPASSSTSTSTIVGMLHQNSMTSRQSNTGSSANFHHQIPSPNSSAAIPHSQPGISPFQSPSSNPPPLPNPNPISSTNSPASVAGDADHADSQSSVQKLIHDMLMSNHLSGSGGMGPLSEMKSLSNGVFGQSGVMNGMRGAMGGGPLMSGRMGTAAAMGREQGMSHGGQQDLGSQLLSGLGPVNGFNNLQFDWKQSP